MHSHILDTSNHLRMFARGDLNAAKELRDSFSQGQQRPNRRGRVRQPSDRGSTNRMSQQSPARTSQNHPLSGPGARQPYQSTPRGNRSFQVGRGAPGSQYGHVPVNPNEQSRARPPEGISNTNTPSRWGPLTTSPSSASSISIPQPSHVQQPDSRFGSTNGHRSSAGLQAPMSNMTNRPSPPKRSALGEEEGNDDQKRMKMGNLAFGQTTESNENSDTPGDYDLIDFHESAWDNLADTTSTSMNTHPAAPASQVASSTRSGSIIDQEDTTMEDVFAPLPTNQARDRRQAGGGRPGLTSSRWNRPSEAGSEHSENDEQQMVDIHHTPGRTVKSGILKGPGLGNSRWAK